MEHPPASLNEWLSLLEKRHPQTIDLGLERVIQVWHVLDVRFACLVITVAGTNGKGSTCAMLEAILRQGGYRVGLYTSPHLLVFNERARIDGAAVDDAQLLAVFAQVEAARGAVSLTYFEFTTLAILLLLTQTELDAVILEVGLGGRLDAVNIVDSDVAIVTSVDIDHTDYLGHDRETIGFEKAGIFRAGRTAICGDPVPPASLLQHAQSIGADLWLIARDFNYNGDKQQWNYGGRNLRRTALSYPSLRGANQLLNASAALAALESLHAHLPLAVQDIRAGLLLIDLPGRFQILPGQPSVILDVAHNAHAAAALAHNLENMGYARLTYAVFGAMQDKDVDAVIAKVRHLVDYWCLTDLPLPRAASAQQLADKVRAAGVPEIGPSEKTGEVVQTLASFATPEDAYNNALIRAGENDRIVVFGSFLTVAGVMEARKLGPH